MKLLIICLLTCTSYSFSYSQDIRVKGAVVEIEKYKLGSRPVFSDEERDALIETNVDTGTGSITANSFTPVVVSTTEVAIIEELNAEAAIFTRTDAINEVKRRKSKDYNIQQIIKLRQEICSFEEIQTLYGKDMSTEITKRENEISKYLGRYNTATE